RPVLQSALQSNCNTTRKTSMLIRQISRREFAKLNRCLLTAVVCLGAQALLREDAGAFPIYTLSDGNSTLDLDLTGQSGMVNWTVDGRDQLNRDWFSYAIGNSGGGVTLDGIGSPSVIQPNATTLDATYAGGRFSVEVLYTLTGGASGSGSADISEEVKIQNLTSRALNFRFYQYADLASSGTVQFGKDGQGLVDVASVTGGTAGGAETLDAVLKPGADRAVSGLESLSRCGDPLSEWRRNCPEPSTNAGWALEWDRAIAANGTWTLTQDIAVTPVPEPSAGLLIFAGAIASWKFLKRT
ncbi:MAG: hypothetical protein ABSA69_05900, partial [Verrucomicrobiota bacterium]